MQANSQQPFPWLPLIGVVVAVVGWGIVHWLQSRRDQTAEKRKIRIQFMIEAYRKLESSACRGPNQKQYSEQLYSAIADIQLLGSPEQVDIAKRVAQDLGDQSGRTKEINVLLNALRSELRRELRLPQVGPELLFLRSPEELGK
jgi:hypothetical protein